MGTDQIYIGKYMLCVRKLHCTKSEGKEVCCRPVPKGHVSNHPRGRNVLCRPSSICYGRSVVCPKNFIVLIGGGAVDALQSGTKETSAELIIRDIVEIFYVIWESI